jgi:hypothetical protein
MTERDSGYHFTRLKHRYQLLRSLEILLWSITVAMVVFYVLKAVSVPLSIRLGTSCVLILITGIAGVRALRVFSVQKKNLAAYLNLKYPPLENSVDLLLHDDLSLSSLQQLQKTKMIEELKSIYPKIKLPHQLGKAFAIFCLGLTIAIGLSFFSETLKSPPFLAGQSNSEDSTFKNEVEVAIKSVQILISPPAYTGVVSKSTRDMNLSIQEGSTITWEIIFDGTVKNPMLIFSGRDTLYLVPSDNSFRASRSLQASGFYQVVWGSGTLPHASSDYYKIDIIKDQPPGVSIENLNQFTELSVNDNRQINLKSTLTDDYGLSAANIVATVSKGSGEAIKFRESQEKKSTLTASSILQPWGSNLEMNYIFMWKLMIINCLFQTVQDPKPISFQFRIPHHL